MQIDLHETHTQRHAQLDTNAQVLDGPVEQALVRRGALSTDDGGRGRWAERQE